MADVKCQGCGASIEFIKNRSTGNMVPVQKVRTVYRANPGLLGEEYLDKVEGLTQGSELLYVSHFETCPKASDFSRKGKG